MLTNEVTNDHLPAEGYAGLAQLKGTLGSSNRPHPNPEQLGQDPNQKQLGQGGKLFGGGVKSMIVCY